MIDTITVAKQILRQRMKNEKRERFVFVLSIDYIQLLPESLNKCDKIQYIMQHFIRIRFNHLYQTK